MNNICKHFPVCKNYHYFQSAGLSPLPDFIFQKYVSNYESLLNEGDFRWKEDIEQLKNTYQQIAKHLNTEAENIVFVENNSLAMSLIGLSLLRKHEKFNIVSLEEEFPSNSVPFEYLNIEMRYVPHQQHRYSIESILQHCDQNTKAVVVSYVQYSTGFRLNIEQLGYELKKRNILFVVNATQAFPLFPIDMQKYHIDVLTCSLHKWGFCGHIGTLFITTPDFRKQYPTPIAGWFSVDTSYHNDFIYTSKNKPFALRTSAQQYQFGSYNIKNRIVISDVLNFLTGIGTENIIQHIEKMTTILIQRLQDSGINLISPVNNFFERSAIVSFTIGENKNTELINFLKHKNVIVALRNNFIRASVNIFTNEQDIIALCNGIESFLQQHT